MAPSHFNSQPWRFVLADDRETIEEVARISGESMTRLLEEGTFWKRYRPYFRFSEAEMEEKRDGIHFDQMPSRPQAFLAPDLLQHGPGRDEPLRRPENPGRGQQEARRGLAAAPGGPPR